MSINEKFLYTFDLNIVVTFLVLFRERSVTRTAECMNVGQPAVSGSLSRLRSYFDDPLFTRTKSGMHPTQKATLIAQQLLPAMSCIETVLVQQKANAKK
jgi:LysR family transcriptional activator of mexEF-oprN operon